MESLDSLWMALALVLVIEGLGPFLFPGAWRRMFSQMLTLRDGQLRFIGLLGIAVGLLLLLLLQ
ncbi:MAG: DUF2065 family protein [Comamonas sp.]